MALTRSHNGSSGCSSARLSRGRRGSLLSSHVLSEVQRVAERVAILRQGRLVTVEPMSAIAAKALRTLEIHFDAPIPLDAFANVPGIRDVAVEGNAVRVSVAGSVDAGHRGRGA